MTSSPLQKQLNFFVYNTMAEDGLIPLIKGQIPLKQLEKSPLLLDQRWQTHLSEREQGRINAYRYAEGFRIAQTTSDPNKIYQSLDYTISTRNTSTMQSDSPSIPTPSWSPLTCWVMSSRPSTGGSRSTLEKLLEPMGRPSWDMGRMLKIWRLWLYIMRTSRSGSSIRPLKPVPSTGLAFWDILPLIQSFKPRPL